MLPEKSIKVINWKKVMNHLMKKHGLSRYRIGQESGVSDQTLRLMQEDPTYTCSHEHVKEAMLELYKKYSPPA